MPSIYGWLAKNQTRGLPSVGLSSRDRAMRNVANPRLGATRGPSTQPDVIGQPSLKLQKADAGVVTILRRRSRYAEFITDAEMQAFERFVERKVLSEARALSQGTLSLRELARRGHPYGRGVVRSGGRRGGLGRLQGARTGVSNLAVVNKQSGELARSWSFGAQRAKGGVTLQLKNSAPQSVFLAFGTSRMRAHGGFTTAIARHLPAINREWARLARTAQTQAKALDAE